ncbi:hypothetical protein Tco_0079307 [Tanacetum coccineum]
MNNAYRLAGGGFEPLTQAYGRKAYFLEDKQIPSVRVFDEVFKHLKGILGGNTTMTLAHFRRRNRQDYGPTPTSPRIYTQKLETAITRDAVTTHLKTASQDLQTASGCMTQPII